VVIKIDLSHLPEDLRISILNELDTRLNTSKSRGNNYGTNSSASITRNDDNISMTLHNENDIRKIKQRIKDYLIKNRVSEYVAVEDDEESKIVILKKHHAEKLGIYHCTHCGMAFDSEIQLSIHQRMHYII
jgi:hypothetical protein